MSTAETSERAGPSSGIQNRPPPMQSTSSASSAIAGPSSATASSSSSAAPHPSSSSSSSSSRVLNPHSASFLQPDSLPYPIQHTRRGGGGYPYPIQHMGQYPISSNGYQSLDMQAYGWAQQQHTNQQQQQKQFGASNANWSSHHYSAQQPPPPPPQRPPPMGHSHSNGIYLPLTNGPPLQQLSPHLLPAFEPTRHGHSPSTPRQMDTSLISSNSIPASPPLSAVNPYMQLAPPPPPPPPPIPSANGPYPSSSNTSPSGFAMPRTTGGRPSFDSMSSHPPRHPRSSRRLRPPPSAEAPPISVGPNVRPPPEYKSRFPSAAIGGFSRCDDKKATMEPEDGASARPAVDSVAEEMPTAQSVRPPPPPASERVSASTLATPVQPRSVASLLSSPGSSLSTPARDLSSVSTTATIASSSHASSPVLTPSSPATTTTTLDEVDPLMSTLALTPTPATTAETPATPKSPTPSSTAVSTPGGGVKKSWADLLRSPGSAAPPPMLPNGTSATPITEHVPRPPTAITANGTAAKRTLAGVLSGVESQFTLLDGAEIAPRGLINNGNLCFANAILQVLVFTSPLWNLMTLLRRETKGDLSGKSKTPSMDAVINFLEEFRATSTVSIVPPRHRSRSANNSLHSSAFPSPAPGVTADSFLPPLDSDPFVPDQIYESLKPNKRFDAMTRGHQEDAEEFLGFFLDTLHEEILGTIDRIDGKSESSGSDEQGWEEVGSKGRTATTRTTETRESPITKIFGGQLRSVLRCPGQKDSITLEPYQRLQLDIQPDHVRTIEDALLGLTQPEHLPDFVTRSGLRAEATKQVYLESFPPVLILHLKRFLYDNVGGVQKSGKTVGYGTELEIGQEVIGPAKRTGRNVKYQLFAVVYHHGMYASGGHYTVAVRQQVNSNLWLHIDDTSIRPISPADVAVGRDGAFNEGGDKNAYLLLYNRMA